MKFIHCSDIHLGSSLTSHFDSETAETRRNELTHTFERLAEYAKQNGVTAIIIAGDLFDRKTIRASLKEKVLQIVQNYPQTDFLYLKGNHDKDTPFPPPENTPCNLKLFQESWTSFDYGEVTVSGVCLNDTNCRSVYDTLRLNSGRINLVTMHGGTITSGNESPDTVTIRRLKAKNIDYLALGDYHSYQCEKLDRRGVYCYSGCLEGRGFDETGEKGFVLLDCEKGQVEHRFIPFCTRTVHEIDVDITDVSPSKIESIVSDAIKEVRNKDLLRVNLTGVYPPESFKNLLYLQQKLEHDFYYAEVRDKTRIKIDPASYADGVSLKSEFIRLVLADEKLTQEQSDKIIACGISALKGEEIVL
ncbi:MAG: metallophosphoesterase [Clostridia bacterium]|nr:metallophosphoesterase [Clostridia bacterium]